jgi:hypothetical protein
MHVQDLETGTRKEGYFFPLVIQKASGHGSFIYPVQSRNVLVGLVLIFEVGQEKKKLRGAPVSGKYERPPFVKEAEKNVHNWHW